MEKERHIPAGLFHYLLSHAPQLSHLIALSNRFLIRPLLCTSLLLWSAIHHLLYFVHKLIVFFFVLKLQMLEKFITTTKGSVYSRLCRISPGMLKFGRTRPAARNETRCSAEDPLIRRRVVPISVNLVFAMHARTVHGGLLMEARKLGSARRWRTEWNTSTLLSRWILNR